MLIQQKSKFAELRCTLCEKSFPIETRSRCTSCGGILSAYYKSEGQVDLARRGSSIWQFRDYLPPVDDANIISLGEGWTPLITAPEYAGKIGLDRGNLLCKMEGQNPTGSFKDRSASLLVSLVKQWKKKGIFLASSGNAAAATSAYCARAGVPCLVLLREDSTLSKLAQIAMYGPKLIRVGGMFKDADAISKTLQATQEALPHWMNGFIWANYNPLILDALKTIAYEIVAASEEVLPDYVFVPTAGGDLLFGLYKGFLDLKSAGQIEKIPKLVSVQGANPSPTVDAIEAKSNAETPTEQDPEATIAGALRSNVISEHGLIALRETQGLGVRVSNREILEAHNLVARTDGIFCEISSATTLAAIAKSLREGRIKKEDRVLAILTGSGFKDFHAPFQDISQVPLAEAPELIGKVLSTQIFS